MARLSVCLSFMIALLCEPQRSVDSRLVPACGFEVSLVPHKYSAFHGKHGALAPGDPGNDIAALVGRFQNQFQDAPSLWRWASEMKSEYNQFQTIERIPD